MSRDGYSSLSLIDPHKESNNGTVDPLPTGKFYFDAVEASPGVKITFTSSNVTGTVSKISSPVEKSYIFC